MPKFKSIPSENFESNDEDSHSYFENDSDVMTVDNEFEAVEEFGYVQKFFDFLYSRNTFLIISSLILMVASYFTSNYNLVFKMVNPNLNNLSIPLSKILLFYSVNFLSIFLIGYQINILTMALFKKSKGSGDIYFYLNELSYHISLIVVLTLQHIYLFRNYGNFYFSVTSDFNFKIHNFLRILIFLISFLAMLKAIVKKVSMQFNYNMYINKIRKCILFDFFICFLSVVNDSEDTIKAGIEQEDDVITNKNEEPTVLIEVDSDKKHSNDDNDIVIINHPSLKNSFILKNKFRSENVGNLTFTEKRLLIKELFNLVSANSTYSGSMPTILGKIKLKAKYKANRLITKLKRTDKIIKIGDLRKFFKRKSTFEFLLRQLDLNPDQKIEAKQIQYIIEKAFKDRYVIYKNLEQINAALDRVSFWVTVLIYLATATFILISSQTQTQQLDFLSGALSTVFGTQIISKILSDNVIESIIFLFVIHPFDIGDRIFVNLNGKVENLLVAELNVFSTTFFKWDGTSFFVPNNVLIHSPISNIRRSGSIMENHIIQVNSSTKPEKLQKLKEKLKIFVLEKKEYYTDYILVNYDRKEDSNKLFIKILMQYKGNFQQYEFYLLKRSVFIAELCRCLKSLRIEYTLPVQNVNIVNSEKYAAIEQ